VLGVERSLAWAVCFGRLVKDDEREASTVADLHLVAFACLMLRIAAATAFDTSIRGHCRDRERAFKYPPSSDDPGTEAGISLR
jgi:hypothetical protein